LRKTVIRPACLADLDAIETLENRAFSGDRLSRRSLRRYIAAPSVLMLAAFSDGAFAGYALIGLRKGSTAASVYSIAVDPEMNGRGLGRALMIAAEQGAAARGRASLTLEVRADNAGAVGLYERLGYERFDVIGDYYEDGQSALRMRKWLGEGANRPR
jgi:ribosomal-protein-alanine N-acetyltransferase